MIWTLDATALLAAYRTGETTPSEAAASVAARISEVNPRLNAYSALSATLERDAGEATERWARGAPLGALDGVPIILKDNLVSAGLPAAWGNAALAGRVPDRDEWPVARLRRAGAVFIGKGNTPEFAVEGFTDNLTFGVTRNPFDPDLTPGGSSGGVVAAVAAGLAYAGIGTDGGGSIRRPAGYTGLLGLKPGIGHVQRGGGLAQVLLDFEVVGPMTRSLGDLRLFDAVLSGRPSGAADAQQKARILAVPTLGDAPCDPGILRAFERTATALAACGHEVETAALPYDLRPLNDRWSKIGEVGLAAFFARDPEVAASAAQKYRDMAERGALVPAQEFYAVLDEVYALRNSAEALWGYDAILMPASAAHPWSANASHPVEIAGQPVGPRGHAVYTGWVNAAGLPALAFPAVVSGGLPIGMQLVGVAGAEQRLMDLVEPVLEPFRWPDLTPESA
jgi:aspartyl-tRNA(Asn)/glutamyl-tRNA(Gln) amidotransferase subunit A